MKQPQILKIYELLIPKAKHRLYFQRKYQITLHFLLAPMQMQTKKTETGKENILGEEQIPKQIANNWSELFYHIIYQRLFPSLRCTGKTLNMCTYYQNKGANYRNPKKLWTPQCYTYPIHGADISRLHHQ